MGMLVNGRDVALDARDKRSDMGFVSHAHSDHTSGVAKSREILASSITSDLIELRKGVPLKRLQSMRNAKLLDAGHILGSKQLLAESDDGYSFVYTGDYQMRESLAAEPIEVRAADVLIIDSTYPYRDVVFEDKNEVITSMQHYIDAKVSRGTVLFGAYALGKAQELVKIANEAGYAPLVSKRIGAINRVYCNNGVRLDYIEEKDSEEPASETQRSFLGIVEVHRLHEAAYRLANSTGRKVFTAVATGFARTYNMHVDVQFELSDHADFRQATEYIDQCSPKVVYTYGSRDSQKIFARTLSQEGYNAHPFFENYTEMGLDVRARLPAHLQR
ncbi:MAG: MBL fold metallo-hydrolase [Candidatus Marsarchaeota archaeon]|nr:MBL fold metallo-hydrolase [Candidatus Marsarchaeota archaeon]